MRQVNFLGKTAFTWLTLMCRRCCYCCVCIKIKSFHSGPGFCVGMKMKMDDTEIKSDEIFVRSLIASVVAHERHARAHNVYPVHLYCCCLVPKPRDHAQYARHVHVVPRERNAKAVSGNSFFLLGINKHGKNVPISFLRLNCVCECAEASSLETYSV